MRVRACVRACVCTCVHARARVCNAFKNVCYGNVHRTAFHDDNSNNNKTTITTVLIMVLIAIILITI